MIESILALILMFLVASGTGVLAERIRVPYTVLLVPVGVLLLLASQIPALQFIGSIKLTPELLFYAFLPVLIFESAYNINWKQLIRNKWSITLLSVVSLIVSTALIAVAFKFGLELIGWHIPWQVVILFGALISATDPVAVLALFKEYGAPKRLSLIFEGESLFNDGTALALYLVLIAAFTTTHEVSLPAMIGNGSLLLVSMVVLGGALGALFGFIFAKLIEKIRDDSSLELTLALVMAHATFIRAELLSHWMMHTMHWSIGISPVIATTFGAITMGNWGRYKLSSQVHEFVEHTLGYLGFLINSIIFILIGFVFVDIMHEVDMATLLVPGLIAIAVVVVARALSVYPLIQLFNKTKLEEHIPLQWQHLLSWGSLRGAIAIAIMLSIPKDWVPAGWEYSFTPQAFIAGVTIIRIYFTLFIKATTIGTILERFQLTKMTAIEYAGYLLARTRSRYKVGDVIRVKVIDVKNNKISLSIKQLQQNPWTLVAAKYKKGDKVSGVVIKHNTHGALVSIEEGIAGLVHVSEFASEEALRAALPLGASAQFEITLFVPKEHRMTLAFTPTTK